MVIEEHCQGCAAQAWRRHTRLRLAPPGRWPSWPASRLRPGRFPIERFGGCPGAAGAVRREIAGLRELWRVVAEFQAVDPVPEPSRWAMPVAVAASLPAFRRGKRKQPPVSKTCRGFTHPFLDSSNAGRRALAMSLKRREAACLCVWRMLVFISHEHRHSPRTARCQTVHAFHDVAGRWPEAECAAQRIPLLFSQRPVGDPDARG